MTVGYSVITDRRVVWDENDCLVWTGDGTRSGQGGYGRLKKKGQRYLTHRLSYEQNVGPIPDGLTIDHLCRNKRCINPNHLEAVTNRVNVLRSDGITAQAARQTHCQRGHEFTPENTFFHGPDGRWRRCAPCQRMNQAAFRERRRSR